MKLSKGFTLTEILVTLIIIAILAGLAIPAYTSTVENSRRQEAVTNLNIIHMGQKLYKLNNSNVFWVSGASGTIGTANTALAVDMSSKYYGPTLIITATGGNTYTATLRRNNTEGGNGNVTGGNVAGATCIQRTYTSTDVTVSDPVAC